DEQLGGGEGGVGGGCRENRGDEGTGDRSEGEDHLVGAESGQLDPLAPKGGGDGSDVVGSGADGGAVAGRPGNRRAGDGGAGDVHGSGPLGSMVVGWRSGRGEFSGGPGQVEKRVLERRRDLAELEQPDAVVERDLGHRGLGGTANDQPVAD